MVDNTQRVKERTVVVGSAAHFVGLLTGTGHPIEYPDRQGESSMARANRLSFVVVTGQAAEPAATPE